MLQASARPAVTVRRGDHPDVPALRGLIEELRNGGGRSSRPFVRETRAVAERLDTHLDDSAVTVLVAELHSVAVGMAVLTTAPLTSLTDVPTLRVDYLVVAKRARRRGVGHALIAAAATHAEEHGMEQVAVSVVPSDREANRFYARLGFAPVVVRRATPVAALRRRLTGPEQKVVDDLTRRRLRRRPTLARHQLPGAADHP